MCEIRRERKKERERERERERLIIKMMMMMMMMKKRCLSYLDCDVESRERVFTYPKIS